MNNFISLILITSLALSLTPDQCRIELSERFSKKKLEFSAKDVFLDFAQTFCPNKLDIGVPSKFKLTL